MKGYAELVELLKHTQATGGLDISEKAICEYQDMIGHSSIEQLQELSRGVYAETFYRVYGHAYGTVEALRFYRNNSTWASNLQDENEALRSDRDEWEKKALHLHDKTESFREKWLELQTDANRKDEQIKALEQELITLKAKLYDMMTRAAD